LASEDDDAGTNDYSYLDGSGLLDSMTSPFSTSSPDLTYGYDSYGHVSTRTDGPSGLAWGINYDPDSGRVASKDVRVTGGSGKVCFERIYDEVGNVAQEARTSNVKCSDTHTPSWNTYEYYKNNRLKEADEFGTITSFEYDGAGNRTKVTTGGNDLITTFDDAGYPVSRSDNTHYATDPLGSLICISSSACPSGTQFKYDAWGRTSTALVGGVTYNYKYDALNRTARSARATKRDVCSPRPGAASSLASH
jgi:YD repeat-containing protein